jgi:hypothetical protein
MSDLSPQWAKADIDQVAVADAHMQNDENGSTTRSRHRFMLLKETCARQVC